MNGRINRKRRTSFTDSFEVICHTILIAAYRRVLAEGKYDMDWKENRFTSLLVAIMQKHELVRKHCIFIKPQIQKDSDNLSIDDDDPDKQPIIDVWLANWYNTQKPNEYFIEAKNLSENNWQKKSGAIVDASKQRGRYIDTGINNFVSGRYPFGCLCGYIVQSNTINIVSKLNRLLKKRNRATEILTRSLFLRDFDFYYISNHSSENNDSFRLKHIFLNF